MRHFDTELAFMQPERPTLEVVPLYLFTRPFKNIPVSLIDQDDDFKLRIEAHEATDLGSFLVDQGLAPLEYAVKSWETQPERLERRRSAYLRYAMRAYSWLIECEDYQYPVRLEELPINKIDITLDNSSPRISTPPKSKTSPWVPSYLFESPSK